MSDIVIVLGRHGYTSAVCSRDRRGNRSVGSTSRTSLTEVSAGGKILARRVSLLDPVRERWLVTAEGCPGAPTSPLPWASLGRAVGVDHRADAVVAGAVVHHGDGVVPRARVPAKASSRRAFLAKQPVDTRIRSDQIGMDRDPTPARIR